MSSVGFIFVLAFGAEEMPSMVKGGGERPICVVKPGRAVSSGVNRGSLPGRIQGREEPERCPGDPAGSVI